ncbi:hypothetical protein [Granulicoccus phenolivorans]|uniref:hypothetical protein n=1 Tax=Granulicoccus phenolivorans TaxID=266854 RepID=UPI00047C211D|nr:hypothetical protein [Granulicoccus phenolivorans]
MKRSTPAIAAVLALAFPFLVSSPAFAEDAPSIEATAVQASDRSVAAINTWLPIDGTVQSVTGPVIVTGTVHVVVKEYPPGPIRPIRISTNLAGVTATTAQSSTPVTGARVTSVENLDTPVLVSYPPGPIRGILPAGLTLEYRVYRNADTGNLDVTARVVDAPLE